MNPLAAIYHPGGADSNGYPVSVIGFVTSWSETTGTVTQVVCVTTDGMLRTFDSGQVQIVDRMVAAAIVAATQANEAQRARGGTTPPLR